MVKIEHFGDMCSFSCAEQTTLFLVDRSAIVMQTIECKLVNKDTKAGEGHGVLQQAFNIAPW